MTDEFWKNKIRAFLHDPPDKVLKIQEHEGRRNEILGDDLKFRKDRGIGKTIKESDEMASSLQRIDLEKSRDNKNISSQFYQIHDEEHILIGEPVLKHPIAGTEMNYKCISSNLPQKTDYINDDDYKNAFASGTKLILKIEKELFRELVKEKNNKEDYFRLWRFYEQLLKDGIEKELGNGIGEEFINLTAYTLSPDHTLVDHADATAAIFGALVKGTPALLMFKVSPVQNFIANARKEKDLWAGSHLLSFLTFQALNVIVDDYGPDAIVFPHLRGQPFFDKCYETYFTDLSTSEERKDTLKIANIPNTFLTIVDYESIESLKTDTKRKVEETITGMFEYAWCKTLTDDILEAVKGDLKVFEMYKKITNYFSVTVEAVPVPFSRGELGSDREKSYEKLSTFLNNLDLPEVVKNRYKKWLELLGSIEVSKNTAKPFDLYALMFELLKEIVAVESRKFEKLEGDSAFKCSLCGELEAIGGEYHHAQMKTLWDAISKKNPILIKKNERLCPLCLLKRHYPQWIKDEWDIKAGFESVSEVALRKTIVKNINDEEVKTTFLDVINDKEEAKKLGLVNEYNSYWENISSILDSVLRKSSSDGIHPLYNKELAYKENLASITAFAKCIGIDEKELQKRVHNVEKYIENAKEAIRKMEKVLGEPEKHYAILMMDGDNMGKLLIGEDMKFAENYLHPKLVDHVKDEIKEKTKTTTRLLTPAAHAAISRALMNFSVHTLPQVVKKNSGELIYAGGDDVLALLPVDTALKCAYEIQKEFNKERNGWEVMPGRTMSAGLFIVHYKHPLYDALDKARALEKRAKDSGRDAIAVGYMKKSDSYRESIFSWQLLEEEAFLKLYRSFTNKEASKRLIFHVLDEIDKVSESALEHYLTFEFMQHLNMKQEEAGKMSEEVLKLSEDIKHENKTEKAKSLFLLLKILIDCDADLGGLE